MSWWLLTGRNGVVGKEAAVELEELFAEDEGEFVARAGVHFAEELAEEILETGAVVDHLFEEILEAVPGQKADVFGEHAEEAAAEKIGDGLGRVAGGFVGFGEFGEVGGDVAGDFGGFAGGVEGERIGPDEAETFADGFVAEVGKTDAEAARVREREVSFAGLGEIGVEFDGVADVDDDEEGWIGFGGGKSANVAFGLAAGAGHGVVPLVGAADGGGFLFDLERGEGGSSLFQGGGIGLGGLELFGFEDEAGALVEVDAAFGGGAVVEVFGDGEFEGVTLIEIVVGAFDAEKVGEFAEEGLAVGALGGGGGGPALNKGLDVRIGTLCVRHQKTSAMRPGDCMGRGIGWKVF